MCCFRVSFTLFRSYSFIPATDLVLSTQQCRWSIRDNSSPMTLLLRRHFSWKTTTNKSGVTDGELYLSESLVQAHLEAIILLRWGSGQNSDPEQSMPIQHPASNWLLEKDAVVEIKWRNKIQNRIREKLNL